MGMSQMCTGAGDYFRTANPHSEKLCILTIIYHTTMKVVEWLVINNQNTPPEKEAFPKPEQRADGSYIYERIPSVGGEAGGGGARHQMLYKKRAYEERPAQPGDTQQPVPSKVGKQQSRAYSVNQVTPKGARK